MIRPSHLTGIFGALILMLCTQATQAGSATWDLNPGSGDWNTAANWTPTTVPNGPADTATFALSNTTNVSISANIAVNGIIFTQAATNPYTITASPGLTLTLSGVGITNDSGTTQNFVTGVDAAGNRGQIVLTNNATAGNGVFITNNGGAAQFTLAGFTEFFDTSSAGSATITNNGGAGFGAAGSFTSFHGSSTAGSATIINNGPTATGAGSSTFFADSSTADSATITNNGSAASNGGAVTSTLFGGNATAGSATIINNGGTATSGQAGFTSFNPGSTAGSAMITNNGGTASGANAGSTLFNGTASAGNASITNNAGAVSGANAGFTLFLDTASAGSATITNNAGAVSGATAGFTLFLDTASAGSATITNNGGTASGTAGGFTAFNTSTAGAATLIANGGMAGGGGGTIRFLGTSAGGTSRIEIFGNGNLDISPHAPSIVVGSIEGDGSVFLGSRNLIEGSNDLSTTFSGVIQDGGVDGGAGGSLTKAGFGTFDLTGANTYTGNTKVNAGVLKVDGSISSNTFVHGHGTLAGTGMVNGTVTNNGKVSPGDAPGILTVASYTQGSNGHLLVDIAGASNGQFSVLDILGNANLNGLLDPVLQNGFIPTIGESFVFLDSASLTGEFSKINEEILNHQRLDWSVTYNRTFAVLTFEGARNVPDESSTLLLLMLGLLGLVTYRQQLLRQLGAARVIIRNTR